MEFVKDRIKVSCKTLLLSTP